jgi:hypothetical protein
MEIKARQGNGMGGHLQGSVFSINMDGMYVRSANPLAAPVKF